MRPLLIHYHIYKNAGSSIDHILKASLGERWIDFEGPDPERPLVPEALASFLSDKPDILAVSSHQLRPPYPAGYDVFPICFLRHPLDRIRSIFEYQKRHRTFPAELKGCDDIRQFTEWILGHTPRTVGARNGQTIFYSRANFDMTAAALARDGACDEDFNTTFAFLKAVPVVGIVDRFNDSLELIKDACPAVFPIAWNYTEENITSGCSGSLVSRLNELKIALGPDLYARLKAENEKDLRLFEYFNDRLDKAIVLKKAPSDLTFTGERYIPGTNLVGPQTHAEHQLRYRAASRLVRNMEVLDVACGEGFGSIILGEAAKRVFGLDVSQQTTRHASQTYRAHVNCSFVCANATVLPFPEKCFDAVVSFETIEHINAADQQRFIAEVRRVLRSDGIFIVSTPNRINYSELIGFNNTFHLCELNEAEFRFLLSPFKIFSLFRQSVMAFPAIWHQDSAQYVFYGLLDPDPIDDDYFVAVCGAEEAIAPTISLSSLCYDPRLSHSLRSKIIREMNREIEKLGRWGRNQEGIIAQNGERIISLQDEVELLGNWGRSQNEEITSLRTALAEASGAHGSEIAEGTKQSGVASALTLLQSQCEQLSKHCVDLQKIITAKEGLISSLQMALQGRSATGPGGTEDHSAYLLGNMMRLESDIKQLRELNRELMEKLHGKELMIFEVKATLKDRETRLEAITTEGQELAQRAKQLNQTTLAQGKRIVELQAEVEQLGAWGNRQDDVIRLREERIQQLQRENTRIGELQKEVESLGAWGHQLDSELQKKGARILALQSENARIAQMQQEIESLGTWGRSLDLEVQEKDLRIASLQNEVEELGSWGKSQDAEMERKDALIRTLQAEVARIAQMQQEIESLGTWGRGLDLEVQEKGLRIASLQNEVEELGSWGKSQDAEMERKDALIRTLQAEVARIAQMQQEIESLGTWGRGLDLEVQQKGARIVSLQNEVESLGAWGRQQEVEIKNRDACILALQDENHVAKDWARSQDSEVIVRDKRIAALKLEAVEQEMRVKVLSEQISRAEETNAQLQSDLARLVNVFSGSEEGIQQYVQQADSLNKRIEELGAWGKSLDVEIEKRDATIRSLQAESFGYAQWGQTLDKELRDRNRRIVDLQNEEESWRAELQKAHNKASILESQCQGLTGDLSILRDRTGELEERLRVDAQNTAAIKTQLLQEEAGRIAAERTLQRIPNWVFKSYRIFKAVIGWVSMPFGLQKRESPDRSSVLNRLGQSAMRTAIPEAMPSEQKIEAPRPSKLKFPVSSSHPKVSIIVPVYNQWHYTHVCLESILETTIKHSYEVILADDGSTDETVRAETVAENILIVRDGINRRFLLNCNNAAKKARGEYLLFLNNDTKCQPGAIDLLVDALDSDARAAIAGSKLIYPDGRLQEAGGIIWADGSAWNFGRGQDPTLPEFNYCKYVDYVSGASLLVRKQIWDHLGGFDERYAPAYCEDSDLCMKVRSLGKEVLYVPGSEVVHYEGVSNGTLTTSGLKSYQIANSEKLFRIWHQELIRQHFSEERLLFLARDRSASRPTILVVDHYVPQYDRDAGSRTMWAFIKAMVEIGGNVKFIGDNFCAHQPYTRELQDMGVEVLHGPIYANQWKQWITANGDFFDMVLLSRPHISVKYIQTIRDHTKAKLIYYGHDLHYIREKRRLELPCQKPGSDSVAAIREMELSLMRQMDVVLSCSCEERDILSNDLPHTDVRYVPPYAVTVNDREYIASERQDLLFVGGFGHEPNIDAVRWLVTDIAPRINSVYPELKFHIVGSNPTQEIQAMHGGTIVVHGFVDDETLTTLYDRSRIVVIPLRYGAGVKGKTVEAMARGLPIISSSCGIEGLPHEMKDCALVAQDAESFIAMVRMVYDDGDRLEAISRKSRQAVHNSFSIEGMRAYWRKQLDEIRPRSGSALRFAKELAVSLGEGVRKVQAVGVHGDFWVGPRAVLAISKADAVRSEFRIVIEGWLPDFLSGITELSLMVEGMEGVVQGASCGMFALQVPVHHHTADDIVIAIFSNRSHCPAKVGAGSDVRELTFILSKISMLYE